MKSAIKSSLVSCAFALLPAVSVSVKSAIKSCAQSVMLPTGVSVSISQSVSQCEHRVKMVKGK
jgi:hypothetical protein